MERSPQNNNQVEQLPKKLPHESKVLRPWTLKAKALAAAAVVGVAGASMSDNAEAQQYAYSQSTYTNSYNQNGTYVSPNQHVIVSGEKALGNVLGAMVVNQGLNQAGVPVRVVGMQPNGRPILDVDMNPKFVHAPEFASGAQQAMAALGVRFGGTTNGDYYFYDANNPEGNKLNLANGTNLVVSQDNQNIAIDFKYRNASTGVSGYEKYVIGRRPNGQLIITRIYPIR